MLRVVGKIREPEKGVRLIYATYCDVSAEEKMRRAQIRANERSSSLLDKVLSTTNAAIFWTPFYRSKSRLSGLLGVFVGTRHFGKDG